MSRKKLHRSLAEFADWSRSHRHFGNREIFSVVNAKLRGHYNYFGVRCNYKSLYSYFLRAMVILRKWLNRRSQRRSCSWSKFSKLQKLYRIEWAEFLQTFKMLTGRLVNQFLAMVKASHKLTFYPDDDLM